jgi:FtsH-binding integral membrane protein
LEQERAIVAIILTMITAAVGVLWMARVNRRQLREMEHRERLAMIERGLIPSPELDPAAFERRAGLRLRRESHSSVRFRTAGVLMFGFGLALMLLLSFAADVPDVGIGIGGAFAVIGAAFFVNSLLGGLHHHVESMPPSSSTQGPRPIDQREPPTHSAP